jgi:hypothetical protein
VTTQQAELPAAVSIAERKAKKARRAFNEADAQLSEARAALRRKPSDATLEGVDLAERERRRARIGWLKAVDDLEVAQSGGRA